MASLLLSAEAPDGSAVALNKSETDREVEPENAPLGKRDIDLFEKSLKLSRGAIPESSASAVRIGSASADAGLISKPDDIQVASRVEGPGIVNRNAELRPISSKEVEAACDFLNRMRATASDVDLANRIASKLQLPSSIEDSSDRLLKDLGKAIRAYSDKGFEPQACHHQAANALVMLKNAETEANGDAHRMHELVSNSLTTLKVDRKTIAFRDPPYWDLKQAQRVLRGEYSDLATLNVYFHSKGFEPLSNYLKDDGEFIKGNEVSKLHQESLSFGKAEAGQALCEPFLPPREMTWSEVETVRSAMKHGDFSALERVQQAIRCQPYGNYVVWDPIHSKSVLTEEGKRLRKQDLKDLSINAALKFQSVAGMTVALGGVISAVGIPLAAAAWPLGMSATNRLVRRKNNPLIGNEWGNVLGTIASGPTPSTVVTDPAAATTATAPAMSMRTNAPSLFGEPTGF